MYITVSYIIGFCLGVEYTDDEDFDYLLIDLLFFRLVLAKEKDATN